MVWMAGGSTFTKRVGTASGTTAQDFNPEDVGLAHANGWSMMDQSKWPALLDFPEFGVPNPVGAMNTFKLFQTGIPFVMAPSGTGSTAGAITLGTAGPAGFWGGSCYLYLPANCLGGNANAAGWYYTLMTSTTAGTVYNNPYVSGQPFIPSAGALVPFVGAGSAYTGVTSAQAALTFTMPGGLLGANGVLQIDGFIAYNGSTNNKTTTVKMGASTMFSLVQATAATKCYQFYLQIQNQGAANAQATQNTGVTGASTVVNTYTALDTGVNQTITFNITQATATDWTSIESFSAIIAPG